MMVDSDAWESGTESSDSSSDEEGPQLTGRARWVKKDPSQVKAAKAEEKRQKDLEKQEKARQRKLAKEQEGDKKVEVEKAEEEFTLELAEEKCKEILLSRGKRNVPKMKLVADMKVVADRSYVFGPRVRLPYLIHLISLQFDVKSGLDEYLPVKLWLETYNNLAEVLTIIEKNDFVFEQFVPGDEEEEETVDKNSKVVKIQGDLSVFVDRLNTEYEKSLRYMENHSLEYVNRLQHEGLVNDLALRTFKYYGKVKESLKQALMMTITLQNTYYKHESFAKPVHCAHALIQQFGDRSFWHPATLGVDQGDAKSVHPAVSSGTLASLLQKESSESNYNLQEEIESYCKFIFEHGTSEMKCVATLSQVFHYALHDDYIKAKDLFLMSKLQDNIHSFEVESQILYNRTMVQLGFCAFRAGEIKQSHRCLMDLCQQGSKRELLAQGVHWRRSAQGSDKKAWEAFQKLEERRVLPFHLHINLDLLDFVHLTCAMLLEVPNMAFEERSKASSSRHGQHQNKVISRTFRRHLELYKRQLFTGPPESARDFITAASLKLASGDWKGCSELLLEMNVWPLFTSRVEETKAKLVEEIKRQGLVTFLIQFSAMYDSISLKHLTEQFELSEKAVKKIVNLMIVYDEIKGSWEVNHENGAMLMLGTNAPTHLQALAGRFAAQLEKIVDTNERKFGRGSGDGFKTRGEDNRKMNFKHRRNNNFRRKSAVRA